jgi:hypothetical protein
VRRPLQLHLIVLEALKLIRSSLPSTVEISQRIGTRDDTVFADPAQMHQIFMNLCTNAAHAMRGRAALSASGSPRVGRQQARSAWARAGRLRRAHGQDQGRMEATTQARIFEPPSQEARRGTGLGLSVVHGIVASHGGAIDVTSHRGRGSTFRVYLPSARRRDRRGARASDTMARGEHILVVDDERTSARADRMLDHTRLPGNGADLEKLWRGFSVRPTISRRSSPTRPCRGSAASARPGDPRGKGADARHSHHRIPGTHGEMPRRISPA